jgi:hypothetical protein
MKLPICLLLFTLFIGNIAFGFGKDTIVISKSGSELSGFKTKNFWQIAVHGGFFIPIGYYLSDRYDNCPSAGAELAYRLNPEVAIYTEIKYYFLSVKDPYGPTASYLESTVGTRFYLRHRSYKSSIFFEAGVGPYTFFQGSAVSPEKTYESETTVRMGGNAGLGCELVLTNFLYATFKAKMNAIFIPNSATTFVSGIGGLVFRL